MSCQEPIRRSQQNHLPPIVRVLLCYILAASLQYLYLHPSSQASIFPSVDVLTPVSLADLPSRPVEEQAPKHLDQINILREKINEEDELLTLEQLTASSVALACPSGLVRLENHVVPPS